jgi:hypothetical protein
MVVILCSPHPQRGYERRFYTPHRSRLVGVTNIKDLLRSLTFDVFILTYPHTGVKVI